MKHFVFVVSSEEQAGNAYELLSYIRSDVQGNAQRYDVAKSDPFRTPLTDGGAADSETQGKLVLRDPLFVEY